jgi:hypothetical protein
MTSEERVKQREKVLCNIRKGQAVAAGFALVGVLFGLGLAFNRSDDRDPLSLGEAIQVIGFLTIVIVLIWNAVALYRWRAGFDFRWAERHGFWSKAGASDEEQRLMRYDELVSDFIAVRDELQAAINGGYKLRSSFSGRLRSAYFPEAANK